MSAPASWREFPKHAVGVAGELVGVKRDLHLSPTELRKQEELGVFLGLDFSYIWICSQVKDNF